MTVFSVLQNRNRALRVTLAALLAAALAAGVYLLWPARGGHRVTGYFSSAVGIYPGDEVRVLGVTVGRIDAIEPRTDDVKITMTVQRGVELPADARAVIVAPNVVSARFVQLAPAYTGGPKLADGASIGQDRTGVPVEWDEVKEQLTQLSAELGPAQGKLVAQVGPDGVGKGNLQGPLSAFVNQAADTFDGNGDSFRQALRELSQTAGRLGDSRTDLFGTIKNLRILVDALSASNEQIVQFSGHVAAVSAVLADSSTDLDHTLGTLNQALRDVKGFLHDNNDMLISQVNKLADFTTLLSDQHDDIEQILHITPNGLANFYNIYNPAQGTASGLLTLPDLGNPVQFICAGTFDTGTTPDNFKRAEICKERMGPVMRRWTMNFPPLMFHPVNSITAYKGQIIYDTPATEAKAETPIPYLQWMPAPGAAQVNPDDVAAMFLPPAPPPLPGQLGKPPGPAPQPQGAGG